MTRGRGGGLTWREDQDGHLDGAADQAVQREHPVGFDVVRAQGRVHLRGRREARDDIDTAETRLRLILRDSVTDADVDTDAETNTGGTC